MIRLTDRWLAPPRGDVETVLAFADRVGSRRRTELHRYVKELWRLCQKYGVDFALAIAHSANETGDAKKGGGWLSDAWATWLNPIGLGITDTVLDIIVYENGIEAARAHFIHLWLYIKGDFPEGDDELAHYVKLDPRWEAAKKKGYAGVAVTLGDLQGRWWTKKDGDKAVVARGNAIFPNLPDQTKGGGSVAERIVFGRVPKPDNIVDAFVAKPEGNGWDNQGPRDQLLAVILHAVKGYAWTTGRYFGNPNEPHGYNALTDWGICGEIDAKLFGADKDGLIMDWNDPDGRGYYRRPWASGGDGSKPISGDAVRWVNRYGIAAINTYGEAVELSLLENNGPVSAKMLQSTINLIAWRVDSKGKIPYHRWPLNNDGIHMLLSHFELGKSSCHIPDWVFVAVINGVRDRLKKYQVVTDAKPVEPAPHVQRRGARGPDRPAAPRARRSR